MSIARNSLCQLYSSFYIKLSKTNFCRCGFAQSQEAYDTAVNDLFDTLEMLNDHLLCSRYLCGDTLTLADVCLFTTLVRFDPVYNVLFKCTKKKLVEYPNLHGYMRDIYQVCYLYDQFLFSLKKFKKYLMLLNNVFLTGQYC